MDTAERRQYAKRLLTHYIELLGREGGVNLDWDCHGEIESIVDLIFDEITEQTSALASKIEANNLHIDRLYRRPSQQDVATYTY